MTARRDLAESVAGAMRDIDAIAVPLAALIGDAVRRHAVDGKITHAARHAILRDVDLALGLVYPVRRGAPSRVQAVIERRAREAAAQPIAAEVARIRETAPLELLVAMERG